MTTNEETTSKKKNENFYRRKTAKVDFVEVFEGDEGRIYAESPGEHPLNPNQSFAEEE
jgi:hypothetical protein